MTLNMKFMLTMIKPVILAELISIIVILLITSNIIYEILTVVTIISIMALSVFLLCGLKYPKTEQEELIKK